MQHLGQHLGIPGFEALMAESLEALGEPGMVERLLRRLGEALGSHKVVLFCPLPGSDDPLAAYQWGMPDDFLARYANLIQGCDAWSEALERQQGAALARGGSLSQQLVSTPALRQFFLLDLRRDVGWLLLAGALFAGLKWQATQLYARGVVELVLWQMGG